MSWLVSYDYHIFCNYFTLEISSIIFTFHLSTEYYTDIFKNFILIPGGVKTVKLGLLGCGAWGFNYIRTLYSIPEVTIQFICDINEESLKKVREVYPNLRITTNYQELLNDASLDGVIIATPPYSHYGLTTDFLSENKAVLVEKPFTLSYQEAISLTRLAKKSNTVLMAGHLLEYHPIVLKLAALMNQGQLGQLRYIFLERTNLGKIRDDVNVLWDLAVHDLSIVRYLINQNPLWVTAQGESYRPHKDYDLVIITLRFPDNLFVQIHANWVCPIKKRQVVIAGENMTLVFDDIKANDKLQLIAHSGGITLPEYEKTLPLTNQCLHFIDCIKNNSPPRTGAADILWVMKVLGLAEQSLFNNGVRLTWN